MDVDVPVVVVVDGVLVLIVVVAVLVGLFGLIVVYVGKTREGVSVGTVVVVVVAAGGVGALLPGLVTFTTGFGAVLVGEVERGILWCGVLCLSVFGILAWHEKDIRLLQGLL